MSLTLVEVLRKATREAAILLLHGLGLGKKVDILFESINLNSKEIYTYETHTHDLIGLPYFNSSIEVKGSSIVNDPKTTIVMQGPINHKSDFTKKTVLHYLNTYKSTNLVLSTWENENIDVFAGVLENPMFKSRFTIIQSQKPEYVGISNINLQIVSTQTGIRHAAKNQTKYLLKTRTDQCMFSKLSLQYLESLVEMYPSYDGSTRILSSSQGTFLLRPYGISDMITFGEFDKVSNFWNVNQDMRKISDLPFPEPKTLRNESFNGACEIYLAKWYLESMGIKTNNSLQQSLEAYRDYFLIADNQILDLVWNKYSYRKDKYSRLNQPIRHQEVSHFLWRDLQRNLSAYLVLEPFLDKEGDF